MRFIVGLALFLAIAVASQGQSLSDAGSLAHFQSGGGWRTTFYLFNTGTTTSLVQLNFFNDDGQAAIIPLRLPQLGVATEYPPAAQFNYTLNPGTALALESDSIDRVGTMGWAKLKAGPNVTGYLIFRYAGTTGAGVQEAVVTAETRSGKSYVIAFDNTFEHFDTYAIANITDQPVDVTMTARDAVTGNVLGTTIRHMPAMGHQAWALSAILTSTQYKGGTVEFATDSAGQISVLGLRFTSPSNAFTSTPPIMKQ